MEVDKPIVAKAVAKLLIPSIFPKVTILFGKLGLIGRYSLDFAFS